MKELIRNSLFYKTYIKLYFKYKKKIFPISGSRNNVTVLGVISNIKYDIEGDNNVIYISEESHVNNCVFYIRGNGHTISIGKGVVIYEAEFWIEDNNCEIIIGPKTTIQKAHIGVTENGSKVFIGTDCMISTNVEIRTGDSHSIIDIDTGKRNNPAGNVIIEDHVWIGSKVTVLKGVTIGPNAIIGTGALITNSIPPNSLAAGIPGKVLKQNVNWKRERI